MIPTILLVHSPMVGPLSLQKVAERLGNAVVADVNVADSPGPAVVVGHSGAGPYLPAIAHRLGSDALGLVYVDAALPYPGETALAHVPAAFGNRIGEMVRPDGTLPPWHEWFAPEAIAALVPDSGLRAAFIADLRPVPLTVFTTPMPSSVWSGPSGYLLLSDGYARQAAAARQAGMVVVEQPSHHLATLTDPAEVAQNIRRIIGRIIGRWDGEQWDIVRA